MHNEDRVSFPLAFRIGLWSWAFGLRPSSESIKGQRPKTQDRFIQFVYSSEARTELVHAHNQT